MDRERREALLREARELARQLPPAALKQSATALAILRQQGAPTLRSVVHERLSLGADASAPHWELLLEGAGDRLVRLLDADPGEAAYFLGWLKRFGVMEEARGGFRRSGPRSRRC